MQANLSRAMTSAKLAIRGLLKAVHRNVTSVAGNKQWRDYIVARARDQPSEPEVAQKRLQLASELTFLMNNVKHHKALLTAYNIGVDPDERNKQMVEAVAKRVGFKLPEDKAAASSSGSTSQAAA